MMEEKIQKAYDLLVPRDQLLIDAMISALCEKDIEIRKLSVALLDRLKEDRAAVKG